MRHLFITQLYNKHCNANSTYPDANYTDRLGPPGKFVENSTKLSCLEITGYRIKNSVMARTSNQEWSQGLDAGTVLTVNSNSRTSNCQCNLFWKKNPIIEFSAYPVGSPSQLIRISGVLLYKNASPALPSNYVGVNHTVMLGE